MVHLRTSCLLPSHISKLCIADQCISVVHVSCRFLRDDAAEAAAVRQAEAEAEDERKRKAAAVRGSLKVCQLTFSLLCAVKNKKKFVVMFDGP